MHSTSLGLVFFFNWLADVRFYIVRFSTGYNRVQVGRHIFGWTNASHVIYKHESHEGTPGKKCTKGWEPCEVWRWDYFGVLFWQKQVSNSKCVFLFAVSLQTLCATLQSQWDSYLWASRQCCIVSHYIAHRTSVTIIVRIYMEDHLHFVVWELGWRDNSR